MVILIVYHRAMRHFSIFLFLLVFLSCKKEVKDETETVCMENCTVIQGQILTQENEGLENINVVLKHEVSGGALGGGSTRVITESKTDVEGAFSLSFYIEDDELGADGRGYFAIEYSSNDLSVEEYILADNQVNHETLALGNTFSNISNRDTILVEHYFIPKRKEITVSVTGFTPVIEGDFFEVRTLYPFGEYVGENEYLNSEYATGISGFNNYMATTETSILKPTVARDQNNVVRIIKRKNGESTTEEFPMYIPGDSTITLEFEY